MPSASEATATSVKPGLAAKDADGVAQILCQHVAMLPEGGGDEVADSARAQIARPAPRPAAAGVAQLGVEGAEHLAAVLAAERRRIAPEQRAIDAGAAHASELARDQAGGAGLAQEVGDAARLGEGDRPAERR